MQKYSLIVGIGNPEEDYGNTYHNAGILAVEYLSQKGQGGIHAAPWDRPNHKHFRFLREHGGTTFVIPTGFMNESGRGVKEALDYFDTSHDKLLVIHDDSDIPLGQFKIASGQGAAGHKGVASLIDALGTQEFARARIGIRSDEYSSEKHIKAHEFVLKKISPNDLAVLEGVFDTLGKTLEANG